jgi:K+-transporting ATPase ATPase A chain
VLNGSSVVVRRVGRPVEAMLYKLAGVDPETGMSWTHYALAVIVFNVLGVLAVYGFLRLQQWLPANPLSFGPMTPDAAFNTAVSLATNT